METKICNKCNIEKQINMFQFRKETNNYRHQCKLCIYTRSKETRKMKFENYDWSLYPDELKCNSCEQIKDINCFPIRKDTELGIRRNCKDCKNIYQKTKRAKDPNFKIGCNLRNRTNKAFNSQNIKKNNKTFDLLGCSHSFLKEWIEFQLYGEMTLDNYGKVWQIDHCIAVSKFNLLNENELRICFNWVNLRPMYTKENISKGNKIDMWLYLLQQVKANYFIKINEQETR